MSKADDKFFKLFFLARGPSLRYWSENIVELLLNDTKSRNFNH